MSDVVKALKADILSLRWDVDSLNSTDVESLWGHIDVPTTSTRLETEPSRVGVTEPMDVAMTPETMRRLWQLQNHRVILAHMMRCRSWRRPWCRLFLSSLTLIGWI